MRKDVIIRCEVKAFQMFKDAWESVDFKPYKVLQSAEDGNYTIKWNSIKWYRGFTDVDAIEKVCDILCDMNEEGYAYKKIHIGENNSTEEYSNTLGEDVFADFYVIVDVNLPTDTML